MRIAVLAETVPHERRVALTPDSVSRLVKQKMDVIVQRGAGLNAGFTNDAYAAAGAQMVDGALEEFGTHSAGTELTPFAEPGACLLRLSTRAPRG